MFIRERGGTEKKFEYFGCGERECSDICFGGWFGICFKECFVERGMGLGIENFYLSGRMRRGVICGQEDLKGKKLKGKRLPKEEDPEERKILH